MNRNDTHDRMTTAPPPPSGRVLSRTYAAAEVAGRAAYAGWVDAGHAVTDCTLRVLTDAVARAAVDAAAADLVEQAADLVEQAAGSYRTVLADRERELRDVKGPCSTRDCRLHRAHSGPCNIPAVLR